MRDIAQKFNKDFGRDFFPPPEPLIFGAATRVMSLVLIANQIRTYW